MAEQPQKKWEVVAKQAPITETALGNVGHLYLQVIDETGKVVIQCDGLAADSKDNIPAVGTPEHNLKVFSASTPRWPTDKTNPSQVLYTTNDPAELKKILDSLKTGKECINDQGLKYDLLAQTGYNSNSIFNTLVTKLQEVVPIKKEDIEKARYLGGLNPGVEKVVDTAKAGVQGLASSSALAANAANTDTKKEKNLMEQLLGFAMKPIQENIIKPIQDFFKPLEQFFAWGISLMNYFVPPQKAEMPTTPEPATPPPATTTTSPAPRPASTSASMPMVADVPTAPSVASAIKQNGR